MSAYTRPQLTEDDKRELMNALARIKRMGFAKTLIYLLNAMLENAILTREVNEHRAALGIDPLPTYQPKVQS